MIINVTRVTQPTAEPIDPLIAAFNLNLVPAGSKGLKGDIGDKGWSMIVGAVADGDAIVLQVQDWIGGEGTKPATGGYIGASGIVPDIADAVDFRGGDGEQGISVTNAVVNGSYNLIITLSTGQTINAGYVRGAPGAAASVTIGTVTTLDAGSPATVENSGTSSAAVLDFGIPAGEDGTDGTGDVSGPASATDGHLALFDGTTGKLMKDGGSPSSAVDAAASGASTKATPVDADSVLISDSAASGVVKRVLWSSIKTTLKTYFDTLYQAAGSYAAAVHTHTVSQLTDASANGRSLLQASNYATMFGLLKQNASSTATGVVELATDTEAQTGTDTTRAITPANLSARTATTSRTGLVELSTDAEMTTGTSTTLVPTVKQVADHVAANAGGGGWEQIGGTYNPVGASAVTITSIPSGFKAFALVLNKVSPAGNTTFRFALSDDNGSTWGTVFPATTSLSSAGLQDGIIFIHNVSEPGIAKISEAMLVQSGATVTANFIGTDGGAIGVVNALQFVAFGSTFDNGSFTLFGIK